jgi:fibronectin type 3 domain-containing protein
VANNTGGTSESSDTISATPGVEPPSAPSNLTATAGSGEVTLNWTAVDGAEDYTIYVSTSGSGYTAISPDVTGTSFTHTGLTNGTNYYYYVVANNEGGASAESNVVSATPTDSGPGVTAPTLTLTPGEQNITVSWAPVDGAVSYNLSWSNTAGSSAEINSVSAQQVADGANPLVFVHAPLVAGVNHTYTIEAVDAEGNIVVSDPETASALPLSCPDTNTTLNQPQNLLAYYSFDGNLEDSAGDFDLTATGDSIVYMKGCANGTSGYFDGDGGYAYNLDFNDNNVTEVADGSWTIALWVNADEDMNKFASMVSTTSVPEEGWGKGFQIDVTSDMRPRFFACKKESECAEEANTETFDTTMTAPKDKALQLGEWTHIAVTMNNQTAVMYINGQEVVSQSGLVTEFNRLKVGLNRWEQQPWKGYLDELMIFGDTLTAEEVITVYENTQPAKVENVTAVNWDSTIVVAWDAVEGVNEYRVYYSTDGTVDENSPYFTVIGGTVMNHNNVTSGQTYTYAVAGVNKLGVGELSDAVSITIDTDTDLLVYYEFDGDLTDTRRKYNDGRYDLTAVGGATVTYSESRFSGNNAAYFDASNGYVFTENLNDAAEDNLFANKSFTISVWFYADPDMPDYSSLMSSRYVPEYGNDDGNWSWQLDSAKGQLRWRAATGEKNDTEEIAMTAYPAEEWSHATFVKHSDGTIEMYLNGSLIHTGVQNNTPLDVLKIGTNRREEMPWKGYIDEFKIYERGLSSQEVCNLYNNNSPITSADSCTQESRVAAQGEPVYVTNVVDRKAIALEFSPDGSKLYLLVGRAYSSHKVIQYTMSTPWDVRTAVQEATLSLNGSSVEDTFFTNDLVWSPDGTNLIALNDSSSRDQSSIRMWDVTTAYDIGTVTSEKTYTIEGRSAVTIDHPLGFEFNSSGTKMIVGGFDSYASNQQTYQRIQEFDLAGSYDFTTITKLSPTPYATFEYGGNDAIDEVIWKADGTKFSTLNLNGDVHMYSVSDRFDLSNSKITKDGLVMNLGEVPAHQGYTNNSFEGLHLNSSQDRLYYIQNSDSGASVGSMPFSW